MYIASNVDWLDSLHNLNDHIKHFYSASSFVFEAFTLLKHLCLCLSTFQVVEEVFQAFELSACPMSDTHPLTHARTHTELFFGTD